jgi:ribosomal protein S10
VVSENFVRPVHRRLMVVENEPAQLLDSLARFQPTT